MAATDEVERIKEENIRFHDATAAGYDAKWLVDYGPEDQASARSQLGAALGEWPAQPFGDALEVGAGTGYLSLNLLQQGAVARVTATDISDGMLGRLRDSAERLGLEVATERADGERLPFADESFDFVFGRAILHHLPNLDLAFSEFHRVLRPGGTIAFCGEPSRYGSPPAHLAMRAGFVIAPLWRRALRLPPRGEVDGSGTISQSEIDRLEERVDIHTFTPGALREAAAGAGFAGIRVGGEELLAALWGWTLRGFYATTDASHVPDRWTRLALAVLRLTRRLDRALLERLAPAVLLYSLGLSARRP